MDINDTELPRNSVICSYKNAGKLVKRYPNKMVLADKACPDRFFYYVTRFGQVRHYDIRTGSLLDFCQGAISAVYVHTGYKVRPLE